MLTSDRQSDRKRNTRNVCHPERSLAMREANRQTESKDLYEFVLPEKNWLNVIGDEFEQPYMADLKEFLQGEEGAKPKRTFYPNREEIFNALNLAPLGKVKVVIIGQDPYHGEGEAHGLCFSVRKGMNIPPSLKNIYTEIEAEYGEKPCMATWRSGRSKGYCC